MSIFNTDFIQTTSFSTQKIGIEILILKKISKIMALNTFFSTHLLKDPDKIHSNNQFYICVTTVLFTNSHITLTAKYNCIPGIYKSAQVLAVSLTWWSTK